MNMIECSLIHYQYGGIKYFIMNLKQEYFDLISEDNSPEELERQFKHIKPVLIELEAFLREKGYNESLIERQIGYCTYFIMNYFFVYADESSLLETDDGVIRIFLGNWYIRKSGSPSFSEMKLILSALFDFFEFIYKNGFITDEHFEEIKLVCKDKDWFERRLKTYHSADGEDFLEWIEEYNYDW